MTSGSGGDRAGNHFQDDIEVRLSDAERAKSLAGIVIDDGEQGWTVKEVKRRLRECARDGERVTKAPGPSQKMTFWVDWQLFRGVSDFERNAMAEGVMQGTRDRSKGRFVIDAKAHSRISEALEWPMRYLANHDNEREVLKIWCECEAKRQSFSERFGKNRSTANRRRDRAFKIILDGLIKDGVTP